MAYGAGAEWRGVVGGGMIGVVRFRLVLRGRAALVVHVGVVVVRCRGVMRGVRIP